jgi:hypothetical protein
LGFGHPGLSAIQARAAGSLAFSSRCSGRLDADVSPEQANHFNRLGMSPTDAWT